MVAYEIITQRIIDLLEKGTVPWHKPWGGPERQPRSLITDRNYRGINAFLLSAAGYGSPFWLSFKQAKALKGYIRKGEHGYPCVYWNWIERQDPDTGTAVLLPFLRHYTVFNVEQTTGILYPTFEGNGKAFKPIEACVSILRDMPNPPEVTGASDKAFYRPSIDTVFMPTPKSFDSPESYYAVLFHELVHSTGHTHRLNRRSISEAIVFGSPTYSEEELVAEMGATYLCGQAGIENKVIDNSASYINTWLSRLKRDNQVLIRSASQAQKAADYVLNVRYALKGEHLSEHKAIHAGSGGS